MKKLLLVKQRRTTLLSFFNWINRDSFYKNLFLDFFIKKFINNLILDGKKEKAYVMFDQICLYLKLVTKLCPIFVIRHTILNSVFLFDYKLLLERKKNKKKRKQKNYKFDFDFISLSLKIKKALKFVYYISTKLSRLYNTNILFSERFSLGILYLFLKKHNIYKKILSLYKLIVIKNKKLKSVVKMQKEAEKKNRKISKYKKEKGVTLNNPYSVSYWIKEFDRPLLYSRR
jgi:hypothetical protein